MVWGLCKHSIKNIIPAISASEDIDLYGVYSRNQDVVNEICDLWNCITWNGTQDMLSDANIDIIFLTTPPGLHYEQGIKILRSGKHLWCDKPFTTNFTCSKKLIELSIERNLSVCEGYMYLYHPQFLQLKKFIEDDKLGKIKTIYSRFGLPPLNDPGFRFNKNLGGSCLLDVGGYPLSAVLSLFSENKIRIVDSSLIKETKNSIDINGGVHLEIDSKINCFIEWGYNISYRNEIDIWADQASLFTDKIFSKSKDYSPKFELRDLNGNLSEIAIDSGDHFELMLKSFSFMIENDEVLNLERQRILNLARYLDQIKENSL